MAPATKAALSVCCLLAGVFTKQVFSYLHTEFMESWYSLCDVKPHTWNHVSSIRYRGGP